MEDNLCHIPTSPVGVTVTPRYYYGSCNLLYTITYSRCIWGFIASFVEISHLKFKLKMQSNTAAHFLHGGRVTAPFAAELVPVRLRVWTFLQEWCDSSPEMRVVRWHRHRFNSLERNPAFQLTHTHLWRVFGRESFRDSSSILTPCCSGVYFVIERAMKWKVPGLKINIIKYL